MSNLFILDDTKLGKMPIDESQITMLDGQPDRMPLYRHPEQAKPIIAGMIEEMLNKDVIENSTAKYLSPIFLVNKPNGKKRMHIDYRGFNQHIKLDIQPLPRLDEMVEEVAGKRFYCTLDMKHAYYHIVLDEASRDISTFSEGLNLYRFKSLPFGLSVAPAIFTRAMQEVLQNLLKQGWVKNYLDDVIVYTDSFFPVVGEVRGCFSTYARDGCKVKFK